MSKTTEATVKFEIEDFQPERKANKFDGAVEALIEAGEGKALWITTDKGVTREGGSAEGKGDRTLFQSAARDAGFSARVQKTRDNGDGTISFQFVLGKAQKRKNSDSVETVAVTD